MTPHDELRNRLEELDPALGEVAIEPFDGPTARDHLERIMTTPTTPATSDPATPQRPIRSIGLLAAAVVLVVAGVLAALTVTGDDDGGDDTDSPPVEFAAGSAQPSLSSCLAVTPDVLAAVPVAFEGTVTAIDGDQVTLAIGEWFVGGDAATAVVTAPGGMSSLTGEIDFAVGTTYLISAADGAVNLCGWSGPADDTLRQVYDQAFPG